MTGQRLLAAAAALLLVAGAARATVINFDNLAVNSTQAVGAFDALGVRFDQTITVCDNSCGGVLTGGR